jgi:hypothetical protein
MPNTASQLLLLIVANVKVKAASFFYLLQELK